MSSERYKGHTPGPWRWFGNTDVRRIYLATVHGGRVYVMQFARWGMKAAQPLFQRYADGDKPGAGVMVDAKELATFEVDKTGGQVVGATAAKEAVGLYRRDINGIANADACLIEDAWRIPGLEDEVEALQAENAALREGLESMCWQFGSRGKHGGRLCLGTMGLSALEEAFDVLGWPDPKPIPEMECEIEGCYNEQGTFFIDPDGQHVNYYGQHYKNVCWDCNTALLGKGEATDGQ